MKTQLKVRIVFMCLILFTVLNGCKKEANTYTGKYITVDFSRVSEIKDQDWIEIDGIRYTHQSDYYKIFKDPYSIPATMIIEEINGKQRREPFNRFSIAIALGNNIDLVSSQSEKDLAKIDLNKRYLHLTLATLSLARSDSSSFTVRTSLDYEPVIKVLK